MQYAFLHVQKLKHAKCAYTAYSTQKMAFFQYFVTHLVSHIWYNSVNNCNNN